MPDKAERLAAIINTTVDGIIVIDGHGLIENFNPAAERLFGYLESEVIGRNISMLMPAPYHDEHDQYLQRYQQTGKAAIIGTGRQVRGLRKDGTIFPLHLSVGEMMVGGERKFTGVLHDMTARVELEDRLREQAGLAQLGEMAAVIAHEIKNPLAGIRGAVQVIGGRLPEGNSDAPMMKEIVARIDSLNAMMKDLLQFARPPVPKRESIDIIELVRQTTELLSRDQEAIGVTTEIVGSAPPVLGDREMLRMVIQNVLINSVHATNGRGRIVVTVDSIDQQCRIAIADSGPGIPDDVRQQIFKPFFTTKKRGTGLGLPTSKRFVEAHHGRISVECPPSGGTIVTIQLPAGPTSP